MGKVDLHRLSVGQLRLSSVIAWGAELICNETGSNDLKFNSIEKKDTTSDD